jgi:hypothetical protein
MRKRRSRSVVERPATPAERIRIGEELRRKYQELHPEWPSAADREEDLQTHIRVSEMLRSVRYPRTKG